MCVKGTGECYACMECRDGENKYCPNCDGLILEDTEVYYLEGLCIGCEHCIDAYRGGMEPDYDEA